MEHGAGPAKNEFGLPWGGNVPKPPLILPQRPLKPRLSPTAGSTKWPMTLARDTGAIATGAGRVGWVRSHRHWRWSGGAIATGAGRVGWKFTDGSTILAGQKDPVLRKKAALRAAGARGGVGKKAGGAGGREAPGGSARF